MSIGKQDEVSDGTSSSSFLGASGYTSKKKSGVLMESTRPQTLPAGRIISLDFDSNNVKTIEAALIDINTSASVMQAAAFLNSKNLEGLIPSF